MNSIRVDNWNSCNSHISPKKYLPNREQRSRQRAGHMHQKWTLSVSWGASPHPGHDVPSNIPSRRPCLPIGQWPVIAKIIFLRVSLLNFSMYLVLQSLGGPQACLYALFVDSQEFLQLSNSFILMSWNIFDGEGATFSAPFCQMIRCLISTKPAVTVNP